ncbi:MAG: hypothetical protein ACRDNL_12990, partial [Spirillospora sp.]
TGPADLQQALLRLPRDIGAEAVRRAAALTSPAGRTAATWLAKGGLPVPEVSMRPLEDDDPEAVISAPPTGLPLVDAVFTAPPRYALGDRNADQRVWSRLLPSHPDVVAAHLLPYLPRGIHLHHGTTLKEFVRLTPGDGPFAKAVGRFLARQLMLRRRRADADEVLLTMAARGDLPAVEFGRHIGRLVLDGDIQSVRIIEALERAAGAGAYAAVWETIAAALAVLCPGAGERPVHGLGRLIALGGKTARWSGARGAIPEVGVLAARKGSSNVVREARALAAQLGP